LCDFDSVCGPNGMIGFICYVGSDHLCWIDHAIECLLVDMAEL
jgi:hypothetical protein